MCCCLTTCVQAFGSKSNNSLQGAAALLELALVTWAYSRQLVLFVLPTHTHTHLFTCWLRSKVSGSKFYYLKGAAALLELALVNWAYSRVAAKGFITLATPDLVRMDVLEKCGFQPRMENTQVSGLCERPRGGG
jgi:hypothetical protein